LHNPLTFLGDYARLGCGLQQHSHRFKCLLDATYLILPCNGMAEAEAAAEVFLSSVSPVITMGVFMALTSQLK